MGVSFVTPSRTVLPIELMTHTPTATSETRRHHRLPSVVPVDFQLLSGDREPLDPEIRTAFTRDLSGGGLCLEVRRLPEPLMTRLAQPDKPLSIEVDISLPERTLRIRGRIAWKSRESVGDRENHLIGVEFLNVPKADQEALSSFAKRAARRPKIIRAAIATLAILFVGSAALYVTQTRQYEAKLVDTYGALATSRQKNVKANDHIGDLQMELRWLAVRTRELIDVLEEEQGIRSSKTQEQRPVIDDLSENIEKLHALIANRQKP